LCLEKNEGFCGALFERDRVRAELFARTFDVFRRNPLALEASF
jgi:hypothetical protein